MIPVMQGMIVVIFFGVGLIYFLYIRNLVRLTKLISPANRRIQPSLIWLLSINFLSTVTILPMFTNHKLPEVYTKLFYYIGIGITVFTLIFTFYMVNKISESLDAELKSRRVADDPKPTLYVGLFMCGCNTATLLGNVNYVAIIGVFAMFAGIGAWIMYWIKTNEYRVKLKTLPPPSSNLNDLGIF